MWWALAAAAIPYVAQALQSDPWQPNKPAAVMPPDRSYENNKLLDNAFNPHADIFQRSSDAVQENVNRALARSGLQGSSAGQVLGQNNQATLATKWLDDQTSRQRMALDAVNGDDRARAQLINEINNQQYQYGAAQYNRDNARNSAQVAGIGGMAGAGMNAYGQYQTNNRLDHQQQMMDANSLAYQNFINSRAPQPSYGVPSGGGYTLPADNFDYTAAVG